MKVLCCDPGAMRFGWAVLEGTRAEAKEKKPPELLGAGIYGLERGGNKSKPEAFQKYRLRLIDYWIPTANYLLDQYDPDHVVGEIVPAVGGGGFRGGSTQSQLAELAITTVFVIARLRSYNVEQIGATSIKARIGGSKKATKVRVRNSVYKLVPESVEYNLDYKPHFDMTDAIGVGLTKIGYDIRHGRK